jgi:hypothetical protein
MRDEETPDGNQGNQQDTNKQMRTLDTLNFTGDLVANDMTADEFDRLETQILTGETSLHQVPEFVSRIYWLGFWAGHESRSSEVTQALHERDIYYRAASRGGFGAQRIKPTGKTFAELETLRTFNDTNK